MTIREQLRANAVAITSLAVALTSFSYTTWRNERTEHNRTVRQASFQLLTALGEMQQVVFHAHYDHDLARGNPRTGWVYVQTIADFSSAMPEPVPRSCSATGAITGRGSECATPMPRPSRIPSTAAGRPSSPR